MAGQRDYAAEYKRRQERGAAQGKTRQEARGHKAHEHIERAQHERDEYGLTKREAKVMRDWFDRRSAKSNSNHLDVEQLIEWSLGDYNKAKRFMHRWDQVQRDYERKKRGYKGSRVTIDELAAEFDYDFPDNDPAWLNYH